jgi:hypothetical protein
MAEFHNEYSKYPSIISKLDSLLILFYQSDNPSINSGQLPTLTTILKKEIETLTVPALRKFALDHNLALKEKPAKKGACSNG